MLARIIGAQLREVGAQLAQAGVITWFIWCAIIYYLFLIVRGNGARRKF